MAGEFEYYALRELKIQRDGKVIKVSKGDAVPEAEFWPNKEAWIRCKRIGRRPARPVQEAPKKIIVGPPEGTIPEVLKEVPVQEAKVEVNEIKLPAVPLDEIAIEPKAEEKEEQAPVVVKQKRKRRGRPPKKVG
jgi:hypothetical protein